MSEVKNFKEELRVEVPTKLKDFIMDEVQFSKLSLEPTEWLFPRLLPKPGLIALTGRPGGYKTYFAHWMARRLSAGLPLFDEYDEDPEWSKVGAGREVRSLIIQEEMGPEIVQERINDLKAYKKDNVFWAVGSGFDLRKPEKVAELVAMIKELRIEVLFFDPFISIANMKDENDNAEASEVMNIILNTFVNSGPKISVVFLHHPSKGQDGDVIRGAGDILGKTYVQYVLEKKGDYDATMITVKCPKHRWRATRNFTMEFVDSPDPRDLGAKKFVYRGTGDVTAADPVEDYMRKIIGNCLRSDEPMTRKDIANVLGISNTGQKFRKLWDESKS